MLLSKVHGYATTFAGLSPGMNIGYARVSTDDQDLTLQLAALKAASCRRVFQEKKSGASADRPELRRMLDQLREGDVVVIAARPAGPLNARPPAVVRGTRCRRCRVTLDRRAMG